MRRRWWDASERDLQIVIGVLLRVGVTLAAAVVLLGGAIYLWRHAWEPIKYHSFLAAPAALGTIEGIIGEASAGSGRGIIRLGILLLVATPIARVLFSVVAFVAEEDWLYVAITLLVLAVLGWSLVFGR
jgi:uncharacterized membrane protein